MAYIKVNNVNLFYKIVSDEKVKKTDNYLIVLHGGPGVSDHSLYYSFWSQFSDIFNVIFFDMRGHGKSEYGKPDDWNLQQWARDIDSLCVSLKIKNPIIAGVSFGGWVAIAYSILFPNQAKKIILCNTEARIDNQAQIEMYTKRGGTTAGSVIRKIYEEPNPNLWSDYVKYCGPYMSNNPYTQDEIKNIKPNMKLYDNFYENGFHHFDFLPDLETISSPVLVLGGTEDPEHPLKSTLVMSDALKNADLRLEILEGAGDPVYRDFPLQTKLIIRDFISKQ